MTQSLAPIVLFTYNRPLHTQKVLDALALNIEAQNSVLYIYCDGLKEGVDKETVQKIEKTRDVVRKENRFSKVIIVEQNKNKGLANSIIDGVTEVVNKHGSVIVIEDDIVASKGFLKYLNDALNIYRHEDKVGCIHAWNYNLDTSNYHESTFFLKGADCWGWATWKRGWDLFNPDGSALLDSIISNKLQYEFDRRGTHKFVEMLEDQILGKNDSWAIRWHASLFLQGKYCLQPTKTMVKNIGLDNSGTHSGISDLIQKPVDFINVVKIKVQEPDWFFEAYTASLIKEEKVLPLTKWQKLINIIKGS